MYTKAEKTGGNKNSQESGSIYQKKNDSDRTRNFTDNRQETIALKALQNTMQSNARIAQLRKDKRVESSAQKHYEDGWGTKYGIQSDDTLKTKVDDSVKGSGSVSLGIYEYKRWVYKGDTYRKGKLCTIEYKDVEEGTGKYKSKYTSIYHCGPSGAPLQQKMTSL